MKIVALLAALVGSAAAFAPSSSFTPSTTVANAGRTSGSALSMAMERTYIMVRSHPRSPTPA